MIFKPKIPKVLQYLSLSAIALVVALSLNTIETHASSIDQGELNALLGKTSSSESTGGNSQGGTDFVPFGVGRNLTGYMAYMLNTDGSPASANAVTFSSPGFTYYTNKTTWVAKSRKGNYTVSDFDGGTAPWGCTPWGPDGIPSHQPQIEAYMLTVEDGVENAVAFVNAHFGHDLALKYGKKEAILVIETLMHFQFAEKKASNSSPNETLMKRLNYLKKKLLEMDFGDDGTNYAPLVRIMRDQGMDKSANAFANFCRSVKGKMPDSKLAEHIQGMQDTLLEAIINRIDELESGSTGAKKWFSIGPNPLVGTVPELIRYKNDNFGSGIIVYDSYLNDVACVSEYMTAGGLGEQAGFRPWDGSTRSGGKANGKKLLSDGQVLDLAVAMMVFTAQTDNQTTCDEPQQPSPHKAPVESTGTTTIIKNYRTKEGTQLTDDGCFVTQNVSSDITIESEGKYQVVGWKTSSSTSTIPSTTWPVPSALRSGTTSSTIKLDSTEKCLYVLLEKTEEPEPEAPADYNYKLTESSITRRIFFSEPDHRLTLPYIENHNFKWIIPAHQTSCPGHTFTDACHGQHIGPHTEDCPEACSSTCTKAHTHNTEGCQDPHYYDCGTRCQTQYASCSGWQWHEKQLKLSINNTQQSNYPDILATKSGWNTEPQNSKLTKHYYLNDASFERTSTSSQSYSESNWDYVAVLLRGKDKLTIAHWQNAGTGSGLTTAANTDLQGVSQSGFTIANSDSGTRKTQDYMETFNTRFELEQGANVDNETEYKPPV